MGGNVRSYRYQVADCRFLEARGSVTFRIVWYRLFRAYGYILNYSIRKVFSTLVASVISLPALILSVTGKSPHQSRFQDQLSS